MKTKTNKTKIITIGASIFLLLIIICGNSIFNIVTKHYDFYGEKFNTVRKQNGLETINKNWKIGDGINEDFKILWNNRNENENHKRKIIEFGYFGAKIEIDSYRSNKSDFFSYYSKYDFQKKKFEYFISSCSGGIAMDSIISEKEFKSNIIE
jgi:hypothetical protein